MLNKFLFTTSLIFLSFVSISAQKIDFGAGFGYSRLTGELSKDGSFGLMYSLEGSYFLTGKLAVGAEWNRSSVIYKDEESYFDLGAFDNTQLLLKGDYFLLTNKFRPYAGIGIGLSQIVTPAISFLTSSGRVTLASEKKRNTGIVPRAGFMVGGFGFEFNYSLNGRTATSENRNFSAADKPFNFYTIKLKYVYDFEF